MEGWSDDWLSAAVQSALVNQPGMEGAHVEVEVENGVVTLRGVVRSTAQRDRATYVARNFGGVARLDNDLMVSP